MSFYKPDIQKEFLLYIQDKLPNKMNDSDIDLFIEKFGGEDAFIGNLIYLCEENLINPRCISETNDGASISDEFLVLTNEGINYLNEDSIGAERKLVTIKIHADTIDSLETIIKYSDLPKSEKETLLQKLKEHGAKELLTHAINFGLSNSSSITQWLQMWLHKQ